MTTRVYTTGDPGDPRNLKLFDADTGKQLDDVAEVQFTISATKQPMIDLRRVNSTASMRCELVQRPADPIAGKELKLMYLTSEQSVRFAGQLFTGIMDTYTVQRDGTLELNPTQRYRSQQVAPNQELMAAHDAGMVLRAYAERAMRDLVTGGIVDPILNVMVPKSKFAQGGIVNRAPFPFGKRPGAWTPATKTDICDECKGTGQVQLFNNTVPCSKGCKP